VTSTSPPSNGPGTRARSSTAAAHCEHPASLKSSRNAATLAATAVACAACDPQLVRTPTDCDQLNYLAVNYILDTTARCQRDHRRGEVHPPCIVGGRSSRTERNNRTRPSLASTDTPFTSASYYQRPATLIPMTLPCWTCIFIY
jgi:hypothetical protein